MLLGQPRTVSESVQPEYSSHENISCEKLILRHTENTKRYQNDLESQNLKRTAPGFISLSTTGTDNQPIKIDRLLTRLRRMKYGTLTAARLHE